MSFHDLILCLIKLLKQYYCSGYIYGLLFKFIGLLNSEWYLYHYCDGFTYYYGDQVCWYTGCAILIAQPSFLGINTRYRKMFRTKVEGGRGGHLMVSTTLTLNLVFKAISRSKWFFLIGTSIFEAGFGKSGKF